MQFLLWNYLAAEIVLPDCVARAIEYLMKRILQNITNLLVRRNFVIAGCLTVEKSEKTAQNSLVSVAISTTVICCL